MPRFIVRAALAVGEGDSERVFLEHVKRLYLPRGCGLSLKILAGFGKGGKGVLDYALGQFQEGHDVRIVMLDTDADWNDAQRARARKARVTVIECNPCLEAVLLSIHRRPGERDSAGHKSEFERSFGMPAHDPRVYVCAALFA
jgi:hypothetical protein